MASAFRGQGIFNAGPHRFAAAPLGVQTILRFALDRLSPGSVSLGPLEVEVAVRGRLVASTDAALRALVDDVEGELRQTGTLVDHAGRALGDMTFITFTPADRTDRGRRVSLAYTAVFRRFLA